MNYFQNNLPHVCPTAHVVECPLQECVVPGSIQGCAIPKELKIVPVASRAGCQSTFLIQYVNRCNGQFFPQSVFSPTGVTVSFFPGEETD